MPRQKITVTTVTETQTMEEFDCLNELQSEELLALQTILRTVSGLYVQVRNMYKEVKSENTILKAKLAEQKKTISDLRNMSATQEIKITKLVIDINDALSRVDAPIKTTDILSFSPLQLKREQSTKDEFKGSDDETQMLKREHSGDGNRDSKRNRLNSLCST